MDTPPPPTSVDVIAIFLQQVAPALCVLLFALAGWALGRLVTLGGR